MAGMKARAPQEASGSADPLAAGAKSLSELPLLFLTELAERIRKREVSSVEATEAALERIGRLDRSLHSFMTVTAELALSQARAADREIVKGAYRGPLHGVPVALKDILFTRDAPTSCGSRMLAGWIPDYDATAAERLYDAGAVLLGKLSMTEFAAITYHPSVTPPVNPWDARRWPGASSSGCAVATAARLCFGSIGTDTGGSIRFPAAACGTVGLKPTYGRVSRYGVFPLAESLDHVGPITRSVADAAAMLDAIAGFDSADPTALRTPVPNYLGECGGSLRGLRLGIDEEFCRTGVDKEVSAALLVTARQLENLGAERKPVAVPGIEDAPAVWGTIYAAECAAAHEGLYARRSEEYNPVLREFLEASFALRAADLAKACARRRAICGVIEGLFEEVDLLLWPAMASVAPRLEELAPQGLISPERAEGLLRFTVPPSLSGHPALTLPCGFSPEGVPIAAQFIARRGAEGDLLRAGFAYQHATGWHRRDPLAQAPGDVQP